MGQAGATLPGDEHTYVFNPSRQFPRPNSGEYDEDWHPFIVMQPRGEHDEVECPGQYCLADHCFQVEFYEEHVIKYEREDPGGFSQQRLIQSRILLLPSVQCRLSDRSSGTRLSIAGSWPNFGMSVIFQSAKEAEDVRRQILANVQSVVLAAHVFEPDGVPAVSLIPPLRTRPGPSEEQKGPFIVGSYLLATDITDRSNYRIRHSVNKFPLPPKYRMYWTELCGPDKSGYIKMYCYNTHEELGCIFLGNHVWPKPGEEEVILDGLTIRIADEFEGWPDPECLPTQAFLTFRSEEMAEMWRDLALQTYETGTVPADRDRATAVNDGVRELMQSAKFLDFLTPWRR